MQERCNSSALAMGLRLPCINISIYELLSKGDLLLIIVLLFWQNYDSTYSRLILNGYRCVIAQFLSNTNELYIHSSKCQFHFLACHWSTTWQPSVTDKNSSHWGPQLLCTRSLSSRYVASEICRISHRRLTRDKDNIGAWICNYINVKQGIMINHTCLY